MSAIFASCGVALTAIADPPPVLSTSGTDLGRVAASTLPDGLAVTIDLEGDVPGETFVIARSQDNRPLTLSADGLWDEWNGIAGNLGRAGFIPHEDSLTFRIFDGPLSEIAFPVTFTFGYRVAETSKHGFIVVDAP